MPTCDAKAIVAGIIKTMAVGAGIVVKSSGDDKKTWLGATKAELDSLFTKGMLRKPSRNMRSPLK